MRSFIWKHFNRLQDNYEKCKCHYFEKEMSCPTKSGTSNLKRYIVGCKAYMAWKAANAFKDLSVLTSDEERNLSLSKVPEQVFKDATNELILLGELPLAFVESLAWKHFCSKVDDSLTAIRNGIQFVRSLTNRLKSFEFWVETGKMTRGSLPLDVKTRWKSMYLMLEQAMKFKVAFEKMKDEDKLYNDYFMELVDRKKRIAPPSKRDWEELESLVHFLVIFYKSTLMLLASKSICFLNQFWIS
ncbi:hypothetical protein N665_0090s0044 [Sinapis alba]|nr:hypothetical protein N665_0090s0044 [Sinapis alba]